jgi:hypothetical protein
MKSPKVGAHVKCKAYQRGWLKVSIAFKLGQNFISSCWGLVLECFGLMEGKNASVAREQLQDSVNSTGVLVIYL